MSISGNTAVNLAALNATVEAFMETANKAADKASSEREKMMVEIHKLTEGQSELKAGQRQLSVDMAEVKPVTDMVTGMRARLVGAGIVLGIIGAVAWAGVLFFEDFIIRALGG